MMTQSWIDSLLIHYFRQGNLIKPRKKKGGGEAGSVNRLEPKIHALTDKIDRMPNILRRMISNA